MRSLFAIPTVTNSCQTARKTTVLTPQNRLNFSVLVCSSPFINSSGHLIALRKRAIGYDDLIQRGVRLKNQKSAILRGLGKSKNEDLCKERTSESFVIEGLERAITEYEVERMRYEKEFTRVVKVRPLLGLIDQIPEVGPSGAVKIGILVVCGERFPHRNHSVLIVVLYDLTLPAGDVVTVRDSLVTGGIPRLSRKRPPCQRPRAIIALRFAISLFDRAKTPHRSQCEACRSA